MKKFTLYVEDNWNKCDMAAIFLFIVGVTCRCVGPRGLGGPAGGLGAGWTHSGLRNPMRPRPPGLCVLGGAPLPLRPL